MATKFKISRGVQSRYNSIATHDEDTIYVCTDTGNIYLGRTTLFEPDAFKRASINGKTVTFTTHGSDGSEGQFTLNLSAFQTAAEVQAAINQAVGSLLKFKGSIEPEDVTISLLDAEKQGNVYNLSDDLAITAQNVGLFVDGVVTVGDTLSGGTNIVVVNNGTAQEPIFKLDVLSGLVDLSGYVEKVTDATEGHIAEFDDNGGIVDSAFAVSDFKTKQQTKSDPTASGTTITAIATITQDANGEITATKKTIQDATTSQKGVVQLLDSHSSTATDKAATPKNVKEAFDLADGKVSDVKVGTTAGNAATVVNNKAAIILTGSTYNASTNKIATMADIVDSELEWGTF